MGSVSLPSQRLAAMTPEEFFGAFANLPDAKPVFYRLYHDHTGMPLFYSMEDLPGIYIEIGPAEFGKSFKNIRVRDGKIVEVTWQTSEKIVPANTGTLCYPQDVAVIVEQNGTYWNKKTYETD